MKQKHRLTFLFFFSLLFQLNSQISSYTVVGQNDNYVPLSNGTILVQGSFDNGLSQPISIPNFIFNCNLMSNLRINYNGHITFGNYSSGTNFAPLSSNTNASVGIVSALGVDLESVNSLSAIKYVRQNSFFIIEYSKVRRSGVVGESFNFQIKLDSITNEILITYKIDSIGNSNFHPEVGLKGNSNSYPNNVKNLYLPCNNSLWSTFQLGFTLLDKVCLNNSSYPTNGFTFKFSPPVNNLLITSILGPQSVCLNSFGLTYSTPIVNGATTYQWNFPSGWTITSGNGSNSVIVNAGVNSISGQISIQASNNCLTSQPFNYQVTVNPNPQVTISSTGQTTFCSGGTVTLSSTGGSSYQWSNNQSGNSISVNSSGSFYTIGTDNNGCIDTSNIISVVVNPNPQVSISNNSSTTFCQGGTVTLTSTGANSYQWSNGQPVQFINVNTTGTYYVIGTDNNGCIDTSNAITVQVNPLPTVVSSNTGPYCEGDNLSLNSSGGVSYSWTGPNGFSSTNQSPQLNNLSVSMGGQYQVSSTDINGCIGNSSTLVVVNPKPTLTTGNPQSVCQGQTISLTSTGGSTYQWSGVNGFTSANQNPTIPNSDLTMSGQYVVVGFNSFGCSDTGFINVVVNPLPVITSSGGGVFCSGSNVSLSSTGGQTYTWSGPNGFMSTQQNPVLTNVTQSMSGNYVVTGTDMNGCSSSSTLTMNVVSGPVVTTQPQNQTVGVPGPATFSIVSSDPNALFQWQTDLGVGFQNLTNSGQYSGVNTNTLSVNNVGFNNNNQQFRCIISTTSCSDTSDVGILFVDDSMTLEGQSEETIKIYPNPTQSDFTIEVPGPVVGERFVVLDNLGRVVLKDDIRSTNQQISIQHLSRGTYVIKVGNRFNQILILN